MTMAKIMPSVLDPLLTYAWHADDPHLVSDADIFDRSSIFVPHEVTVAQKGPGGGPWYFIVWGTIHTREQAEVLYAHLTLAKWPEERSPELIRWQETTRQQDMREVCRETQSLFTFLPFQRGEEDSLMTAVLCRRYGAYQATIRDDNWLHRALMRLRRHGERLSGCRALGRDGFHFSIDHVVFARPADPAIGRSPEDLILDTFLPLHEQPWLSRTR